MFWSRPLENDRAIFDPRSRACSNRTPVLESAQRADSHKSTLLRTSLARSSRRTKSFLGKFANILAAYLQIRSLKLCSYYHSSPYQSHRASWQRLAERSRAARNLGCAALRREAPCNHHATEKHFSATSRMSCHKLALTHCHVSCSRYFSCQWATRIWVGYADAVAR